MPRRAPRIEDAALAGLLYEALQKGALGLADACRCMRASERLTQVQFASRVGVATKVIKELESGKGNPTLESLKRIASSMGLQVAFVRSPAVVSLGGIHEHVERQAGLRRAELRAVKRGRTTLKRRHKNNALRGTDFTIDLPKLV